MGSLSESEMDDLCDKLLRQLSNTPFACYSPLVHLSSGTTNFVLRGDLVKPLDDGRAKTVIVKHFTNFAAVNKAFPIDISRCVCYDLISLYQVGLLMP